MNTFNNSVDQSGAPAAQQGQGSSFNQEGAADTQTGQQGNEGQLTQEQVAALQKKNEHADQHIARLEAETKDYREKMVNFEERLAAIPDFDSIKDRLDNLGEGSC